MKLNDVNVRRMLSRATQLNLTGRNGQPITVDQICELEAARRGLRNSHVMRATDAGTKAVLSPITNEEFALKEGADSVWIQMGGFKVHLYFTGEGLVSDVFAKDADSESIASTYAFFSDSEAALADELGIDLDDVAEWVGQHYRRNFDAEPPVGRLDWIKRYHEAVQEAKEIQANPKMDLLEEVGYTFGFQLSTETQQAGWVWEAPSEESESVFASEEEAVTDAWMSIAGQTMAIHNLSSEDWDGLGLRASRR